MTNPPIIAGLITYGMALSIGAHLVLDTHPGGFGAQGDRVAARLQPLHRWLARRAILCLVTEDLWRKKVEAWGTPGLVVHEAPGDWQATKPVRHRRLRILYVGRFGADEPARAVIGAAALVPECDVIVTGELERCPPELLRSAPPNVTFAGFLDSYGYRAAVMGSDAMVTLSTEPASVMRAACEALYAGRPLILSDWPVNRELFPYSIHVANNVAGLAWGLREVDINFDRYAAMAEDALDLQFARWQQQRHELQKLLADNLPPLIERRDFALAVRRQFSALATRYGRAWDR
ncbi:MAG: hypothetical protein ACRDYB_00520 [Acidimicrobiales bacterium]